MVRSATLEDFLKNPNFAHEDESEKAVPPELTLYPNYKYTEARWGMGHRHELPASAARPAWWLRQAENNIPIVGKELVTRGRIMHWIRVDA